MTYYLIRHFMRHGNETLPFTARDTMEAIRTAVRLHEPRAAALYAQVTDHTGRVICTLGTNAGGPGRTKLAYQTEIPHVPPTPKQLELWKQE